MGFVICVEFIEAGDKQYAVAFTHFPCIHLTGL